MKGLTLEQVKRLKWTDTLKDQNGKLWRVNGKVKTWARSPGKVQVPVKHGLYTYDYVTESNMHLLRKV